MRLILNATSSRNHLSGRANRFVFDQYGGSIGRAQDNDCVLPDPELFISSHHAVIQFKDGAYILTDTSRNGVFLNYSDNPLGKNNTVRLNDGDHLAIGYYELSVTIEPEDQVGGVDRPGTASGSPGINPELSPWGVPDTPGNTPDILDGNKQHAVVPGFSDWDKDESFARQSQRPAAESDHTPVEKEHFPPPPSMQAEEGSPDWDHTDFKSPSVHEARHLSANEPANLSPAADAEVGYTPDWDHTEFSSPSVAKERGLRERDGREIAKDGVSSAPASIPESELNKREACESGEAFKRIPPSSGQDINGPSPASPREPVTMQPNGENAVQTFLQAAGLNETQIPPEAALALMKLLGGLYREIVQGLMDVLQARFELKNEFRMRHTQIRKKENNPLKFTGRVDDALEHLFLKSSSGFLAPEAAFQEAFQDIKDHQIAMVVGMRAAFESVLRRFDPELMESSVTKEKRVTNSLPISRKARCWERYEEWYAEISVAAEDDFQRLFGDEFTRAYEDQVARLSLLRKKPHK